ncbi:hypothetical protein BAX97_03830 [Elizabethkingia meningoseptica]|uniref:hypothetical protein n=1 Tax=Elizabethkingia meningoseptica TaxID=238 RepID=UPI00068733EC|nr:hypothetical protein [Elizabethkingia meningoseptica]AQX06726.1 hypothetical protein BBD33_16325 [Elizabethkingia meningoseptica]AQX48774.1 hypothetical protein B5G46_16320 [Elizabethkingia meningoseptica]KUY14859.1 hypothetical protein ATB99_10140 [Elizabethkingia meningoseptica]MCL1676829.1 hypothetical protein [Elizabethkingia meningoseptica]MCL1684974.1 hypothetical protein [Elizabethkingia meningoseptica]
MKSINSYIILFLLSFASIFSNDWTNSVAKNTPSIQDNIVVNTIDLGDDTDISILVSSRTIHVLKKVFYDDSYFYSLLAPTEIGKKVYVTELPVHIKCSVKSFLHLLQLY